MEKDRKKDRRSIYTEEVIKDSLLALLKDHPYEKINVSLLSRKASITRTTFYLHYESIDEVLNAVLDDAFLFEGEKTKAVVLTFEKGVSLFPALAEITLPACQRVADSEKYHRLLEDPSLAEYILSRLYRHEKKSAVSKIRQMTGLKEEDADLLFRYNLRGSFYINRLFGWKKDKRRYHALSLIDAFAKDGYQGIRKRLQDPEA